jgi:hypothetical protein
MAREPARTAALGPYRAPDAAAKPASALVRARPRLLEFALTLACLFVPQEATHAPLPPVPATDPATLEDLRGELRGLKDDLRSLRERAGETFFEVEKWHLFAHEGPGWTIDGWLAQSFTFNPSRPRDGYNGPVTWPDRANEYQLTELYGTIQNTELLSGEGWSLGARVDLLYGSNYRFVTSAGLESQWNNDREYGFAIPNAYAEITFGDVTAKVGHFTSPVGYCAIGTKTNFFQVLPYTFQYGEPFTHTGALATAQLRSDLTVGLGIIEGWDSTANWSSESRGQPSNAWNRHVGALLTATKSGVLTADDSLAYVGVWSSEPDLSGIGREPRYLQTLVWSLPLAADWLWVVQSDFGYESHALTSAGGGAAQWYGLNQYLLWTLGDAWQLGANLEWFRDDDGFRVVGSAPSFGSPRGRSFGRGPFRGNFYRAMLGANLTLHPNVTLRHAVVFDVFDGAAAAGLQPFDDGGRDDQWLFTVDLLLSF